MDTFLKLIISVRGRLWNYSPRLLHHVHISWSLRHGAHLQFVFLLVYLFNCKQ